MTRPRPREATSGAWGWMALYSLIYAGSLFAIDGSLTGGNALLAWAALTLWLRGCHHSAWVMTDYLEDEKQLSHWTAALLGFSFIGITCLIPALGLVVLPNAHRLSIKYDL